MDIMPGHDALICQQVSNGLLTGATSIAIEHLLFLLIC